MKCPHCHKPLFYEGKYSAAFFMSKGQRHLMELLAQERLVEFHEISATKSGAQRMIEELRKSLDRLSIPLRIRSVRSMGYILVDPAAKGKPPSNGHINQRPVDDEAGSSEGASL